MSITVSQTVPQRCLTLTFAVNGDIAQEFVNYWVASGDTQFFEDSLFPVYNSIATFYSELLTKNGSSYQLTNMTDPDEVYKSQVLGLHRS